MTLILPATPTHYEPQNETHDSVATAHREDSYRPGPEIIKHFTCSTKLSMKFKLLINTEMPKSMEISG